MWGLGFRVEALGFRFWDLGLGYGNVVFFPTLAVGLLDFKVDVVFARLEADFRDQPPSIPAVPHHQVP